MRSELEFDPVTPENLAALEIACQLEDGHIVPPGVTHIFKRDGEIVSAMSVFSPVVMFWAHSTKMKPRESFEHVRECQLIARARHPNYLLACSSESPFRPLLEKHFGFRLLGGVDVFDCPEVKA